MTTESPRPDTIERLGRAVYPSLAMLAGMELELFTPLKDGPMTSQELAQALGANAGKLRPLLYSLTAAGLLLESDGKFANTPESQRFLVQGSPDYLGGRRVFFARRWSSLFKTSETIRTGIPQGRDRASQETTGGPHPARDGDTSILHYGPRVAEIESRNPLYPE